MDIGNDVDALRRVLVATDFSEGAAAALGRAFELAGRHGAHVTVLHVAPREAGTEIMGIAEDALRGIVRDAPVPADSLLSTGEPSARITLEAEQRDVDVVVVGAHGAHWLRDVFLGSTAEMVVDTCRMPLLLVKSADMTRYATVMATVDTTRRSFRAAQTGMRLVPGARHILAHGVTVIGENLLRLTGATDQDIDELRRGQLDLVRPEIEYLADELTPVPDELAVEPMRPESLVASLATQRGADLLVVGVRRGAGLRRALTGSVSRHAMQRAECDVLVVPLQREPSRAGDATQQDAGEPGAPARGDESERS